VVAVAADITGGFNIALACCTSGFSAFLGNAEALHGAFIQDGKGEWVKDLVSRASADGRGVSYTIRPDAFWYWGGRKVPVTFRDFVYTLREIDDPASQVAGRLGYANLDPTRFAHRGNRQVTFFWRTRNCSTDFPCDPYADWQALFAQLYPSFALHGVEFNTMWTTCICGSDGKPVADGPFYLARYTPGQGSVLRVNPYYHDRPKLAEVDIRIISDTAQQAEAIRSGQVDLITPPFVQDLLTLRSQPGLRYTISPFYSLEKLELREGGARGAPSVTKSASNVLLRAPWMRQAIMLALDRQSMIDKVYGAGTGLRPSDDLLYFPHQAGYRPDFARWNHDPAKAITILRKHCTGGPTSPDSQTTRVWRCDGLPALFRYVWPAESVARTTIEQIAAANLKAVGIVVAERPLPSTTMFGTEGIVSGDFDLAQFGEFTTGDPGDWYEEYRCEGAQNWTGYCSHAVDTLLRAANGDLNPSRRTALYKRADTRMALDVPGIPLFQKPNVLISNSALLGLIPNPGQATVFWNIQDWHWKR
jgi:peptide/nickel transport system substrate-binding protein